MKRAIQLNLNCLSLSSSKESLLAHSPSARSFTTLGDSLQRDEALSISEWQQPQLEILLNNYAPWIRIKFFRSEHMKLHHTKPEWARPGDKEISDLLPPPFLSQSRIARGRLFLICTKPWNDNRCIWKIARALESRFGHVLATFFLSLSLSTSNSLQRQLIFEPLASS